MRNIISEINRYTSISRERELTNTEKNERNTYRKLYLKKFRENFRNHLDNIKVVYMDENGNEINPNQDMHRNKLIIPVFIFLIYAKIKWYLSKCKTANIKFIKLKILYFPEYVKIKNALFIQPENVSDAL